MDSVKIDLKYEEKAGRLELIIRWLWAIPVYIVLFFVAIIGVIGIFLQWFHILFLGKRNETFYKWSVMYVKQTYKFMAYMYLITDERTPITPEEN